MTNDEFKQSFHTLFHDSLGLAVYRCGLQRCAPDYSWGPGVRDHYLIHYVLSGRGSFDSGKAHYDLSAGDGFLVFPGSISSYRADHDEPWEYCWVGFNGTDAGRLISETGLSEKNPLFHYDKDRTLEQLLKGIYQAKGPEPWDDAQMTAALLLFLSALMKQFGKRDSLRKNGYEYVKKSLQFIDYNYFRTDLNINEIAVNAGISRSHLYRLFMEHISMPPNEYLMRYRIGKAAALLKSGHLSVGEAAYSTGFSDQLYFSRVFKKQKGVPPSKYARDGESGARK